MIKKYYSKYTGKQIDEAVAALIENNVKIEDLNEEVVELINSKANEEDLAALKEEVNNEFKVALEDLVGSASELTPVPTSGMVETVYVNRNLTIDEIEEMCKQLTTFSLGSTCIYNVFETANCGITITGTYDSSSPNSVSSFMIYINNTRAYNSIYGWETDSLDTYEINEEIIRAGTQNDLLVNLVSTTPFGGSKGRVGELETAVEELHNEISELEEVSLHIMTQNHVLCPYIVEDLFRLSTNQISMIHRKMTTEEINFFTELKGNSTSKIAIPIENGMIYAEKVIENDSADLKTMSYIGLSGTESYTMDVILRSDGGEDLNNTIDIFKYTFAEKHNIDMLETEVEELKNKSTLIRLDSVGIDLLTAYNEQSVDRNLIAEEVEVFNQFVNNENLTSLYAQVEGLADVVLTKSAYLTQDSVDIISFSAIIMDCYLDAIVCIYPEGSGVLGSIEISKRDLTMPKAHECPYFGDEIAQLVNGGTVPDRKLTDAELEYFTELQDSDDDLKIKPSNFNMYMYFQKANCTKNFRLMYNTRYDNQVITIVIMFNSGMEAHNNTVGIMISDLVTADGFNNLEERVITLESTIGDINTLLDQINGEVM